MTALVAPASSFVTAWEASRSRLAGTLPGWAEALRRAGIERFREAGFPGPRDEAWRFTRLGALEKTAFVHHPEPDCGRYAAAELSRLSLGSALLPRVTLVNGAFAPHLSALDGLDPGVSITSIRDALASGGKDLEPYLGKVVAPGRHRFASLADAFLKDGVAIRAAKNATQRRPIHLLFLSSGNGEPVMSFPRVLIQADPGSRVDVLEEFAGDEGQVYFQDPVTEIVVGENARVEHYRLQRESREAFHVATLAARLARNARLAATSVSLGGKLVRVDIDVELAGEGAECDLNGLYVAAGKQHADHHTFVDHIASHTTSRELYKGVLDGRGTGVFNGRVRIRAGTQGIDAAQKNNNLLLSSEALVNTNPELEIFTDDVKATHGATIGQLDEEQIFYLRSRGIPMDAARHLLIRGFAGEMLDRIAIESLRERLVHELRSLF